MLAALPTGVLVAMASQEFLASTRVYECCQDCNCRTSPAVAQNLQLLVSFLRPSSVPAQNVDRVCGPPYPCVGCGQCDFEHSERTHDQLAAGSGGGTGAFVAARVSTSDARSWIRLDAFASDGTHSGSSATEATALGAAHPALAVWPGEHVLLLWDQAGTDGSAHNVLAQGLAPDTAARGPAVRLNTHSEGSQQSPAVAAVGQGALVVWESWWQDGDAGGIVARKVGFDPDGAILPEGSEIQVNTTTEGSQSQPSAARLGSGQVVVVWEHAGPSGRAQIRARILDL